MNPFLVAPNLNPAHLPPQNQESNEFDVYRSSLPILEQISDMIDQL